MKKMKKADPANPELIDTIRLLKKTSKENNVRIWRKMAEYLSRTRRRRIAVNLSRINRYTKNGETVAVPGKVLAAGAVDHPVTVIAFAFSERATAKIRKAKGKCLTFSESIKKNPKGSGVKIIG
jgi:large subunit ribosomal protein L18e